MQATILGIGNAITDIICQVNDDFLQRHQLIEGSMSLSSGPNNFAITANKICAGGSVANTIATLAILGADTSFFGVVGGDNYAKQFIQSLCENNVNFIGKTIKNADSATSFIFVNQNQLGKKAGERTMLTYLGCASTFNQNDCIDTSKYSLVYIEGYLYDQPEPVEAINKIIATANKVAFSLSDLFCVKRHRQSFLQLIKNIDILFANNSEICALLDQNHLDLQSVQQLCHSKLTIALTDGDNGCYVITNKQILHIPTTKIASPLDTTGAGDIFAAGFLYAWQQQLSLEQSGRFANFLASKIIMQFGARFDKQQLQRLKQQFFLWTKQSIAIALQNELTHNISEQDFVANEIFIDTRKPIQNGIFLALTGSNFNGNNFAMQALQNGAVVAIVDNISGITNPDLNKLIVVKDCQQALIALAKYKRATTSAKIIAITGSVGKTSTKELLASCFSQIGQTFASAGNLNNHIGLPLSLANMPNICDYAIFEMGMNHANEIAPLSQLAKPDLAIITTVQPVHIEFFASEQQIAQAKAEIFSGLQNGKALLNISNQHYDFLYQQAINYGIKPENIFSFGKDDSAKYALIKATITAKNNQLIQAKINKQQFSYNVGTISSSIAENSIIAMAAIDIFQGDISQASLALANFSNESGRGKPVYLEKLAITIVDDTYNASIGSIRSGIVDAVNHQQQLRCDRLVIILGDMLELGKFSLEMHIEAINFACLKKPQLLVLVGNEMSKALASCQSSLQGIDFACFADSQLAAKSIYSLLMANDLIYIKGSRGTKMENIINHLKSIC